jgi:hypothetical protein
MAMNWIVPVGVAVPEFATTETLNLVEVPTEVTPELAMLVTVGSNGANTVTSFVEEADKPSPVKITVANRIPIAKYENRSPTKRLGGPQFYLHFLLKLMFKNNLCVVTLKIKTETPRF